MRTPMIAKIVQTAKQTVNAMVDIHSARLWPGVAVGICVGMTNPVLKSDGDQEASSYRSAL